MLEGSEHKVKSGIGNSLSLIWLYIHTVHMYTCMNYHTGTPVCKSIIVPYK